ncbi:GNAT family N-acetyltransferase [Methylosinus sp. Sm6]|uniref:GNAT family N-acetyltransferase n=1 Tax=Methylosinus sp. Sm6 TaxID=2866948 RepID=UPI001C997C66|nr:GNAT family protein [Methylosinus sp. Sm6]MBY6243314.1 GNAT family N-acetyltransferase [Methylosinus sp. Sm6]
MGDDLFPPLETDRLRLRCVAQRDAVATSRWMTPAVSRWLASWPLPFTPAMAAERIEHWRALARAGDGLGFAIADIATDELLGWATIEREDDSSSGSFGYWLAEPFQGRGYMRELAPVALAAGFERLDLARIRAGAQIENTASFAVMQACGMRRVGEAMVFAPARGREEPCLFYEVHAGDLARA